MRYFGFLKCFNVMITVMVGLFVVQEKIIAAPCPCDIYATGGTPCVAAHSTVRALYSSYNGPLYQVRRTSDNQTKDIGVLATGGFANAADQDAFLSGKPGTISIIYDQSSNGNHLTRAPIGGWLKVPANESDAVKAKIMINGHTAYGVYTYSGAGYRNNSTKGVVTGNEAEGMYAVYDGKHVNWSCCFDYGNAQTNMQAKGPGTMESIYFGTSTQWGHGSGNGPWVMNDCEYGIQAGVDANQALGVYLGNTSIVANYVTGIVKSPTDNSYTIKGGDANTGKLKTMYSGRQAPGYYPKKLEGAIVLGLGGDNSNGGEGTFFEGAMTKGCPTDTTEDSVQANIIAARYGSTTTSTIESGAAHAAKASMFKTNYNPSTASAVISYSLQSARQVSVRILDQRGRRIASVVDGVMPAGRNEAFWNAKQVPAGVYVWRIAVDGKEAWTGKIIVGR
jgi:non-reducing end alpha-L-arabinofuranosidase